MGVPLVSGGEEHHAAERGRQEGHDQQGDDERLAALVPEPDAGCTRHETAAFRSIMRDPRLRKVIKIIETPKADDPVRHDRRMLRRLRAYARGSASRPLAVRMT